MSRQSGDEVRYALAAEGAVAVITLNRPARLNAVNPELVEALCRALERASADGVGAVVLTGEGRSFSAGHDLREPVGHESDEVARQRIERLQDVTRLVRAASFPVVAAVHGYALGAGCEFALACDLVVAAESAVFGFPEVEVGLAVTGGISYLLPMTVGPAKAKELVLLGGRVGSAEAARLGLVHTVVPDGEDVATALSMAEELARRPRTAMGFAKKMLDQAPGGGIEGAYAVEIDASLALRDTDDARRASDEFRRRRGSAPPAGS